MSAPNVRNYPAPTPLEIGQFGSKVMLRMAAIEEGAAITIGTLDGAVILDPVGLGIDATQARLIARWMSEFADSVDEYKYLSAG